MTINERVKKIRESLGLTQEEFGKGLSVKKAAVSKIEKGENGVSPQMVALICNEYNINEDWLRTGKGKMKQPEPENEIDAVVKKYKLPDEVRIMFEQFVHLPPEQQEAFARYAEKVSTMIVDTNQKPVASSPAASSASDPANTEKNPANASFSTEKTFDEMTDQEISDQFDAMKEKVLEEKRTASHHSPSTISKDA